MKIYDRDIYLKQKRDEFEKYYDPNSIYYYDQQKGKLYKDSKHILDFEPGAMLPYKWYEKANIK